MPAGWRRGSLYRCRARVRCAVRQGTGRRHRATVSESARHRRASLGDRRDAVRSGAVDLVVIDSVAALVPQSEIEGDMGDQHMGLQARLMSQALRKLTGITHRTGTTI